MLNQQKPKLFSILRMLNEQGPHVFGAVVGEGEGLFGSFVAHRTAEFCEVTVMDVYKKSFDLV